MRWLGRRGEASPSRNRNRSATGAPVFVDDTGRRLFHTRAAAWSGSTTVAAFLVAILTVLVAGSLGDPASWSGPLTVSITSPTPTRPPARPEPTGRSTAEAVITVPALPTTGPGSPIPTRTSPTTARPGNTPSATASVTGPGKGSQKPTAPPGRPTASPGKPTTPPGKTR